MQSNCDRTVRRARERARRRDMIFPARGATFEIHIPVRMLHSRFRGGPAPSAEFLTARRTDTTDFEELDLAEHAPLRRYRADKLSARA